MEKRLAQVETTLLELRKALKERPSASITDNGEAAVPDKDVNKGEVEIYYSVAFATPPKITITDSKREDYAIVEQKADHFKIKNNSAFRDRIRWVAEGQPAREKAANENSRK